MDVTGFMYNPTDLPLTTTKRTEETNMSKPAAIALLYIMCALCSCERSQLQQDPSTTAQRIDVSAATSRGESAPTQEDTPSTSDDASDNKNKEYAPIPELGGRSTIDQDGLVRGESMNDLKAKYGEPASTYAFNVDDGVPEFRVELLNDYPPGADKSKGVEIMEHTYKASEGDSVRLFTIWYHEVDGQWIALQAISYSDNVEF